MRRFIILATFIVFSLALFSSCMGLALAASAPFQPGDFLFPLQSFAEQERANIAFSDTGKAVYYIRLAGRRAEDLALRSGTRYEMAALIAMDNALDRAEQAASLVPASELPVLLEQLGRVVQQAKNAVSVLIFVPQQDPQTLAEIQAQLNTLQTLVGEAKLASESNLDKTGFLLMLPLLSTSNNPPLVAGLNGTIDPHAIQFPQGSGGAEHSFFPLVGQHGTLECESCHTQGQFAGTPAQCASCHTDVKPVNHFTGDCAACHIPTRWQEATFDHNTAGAKDCRACHTQEKPANHFKGQCSSCHSTRAWKPANFNHKAAGATDCKACHTKNKPANHFSGQCSACHNTNAWKPASFNHKAAGATDCKACHTKNKPANHFSGQCSSCHNTNAWKPANFNHSSSADCTACHTKDKPNNHFSGQCSSCHSTNAWKPANFNHSGKTDCQSCHNRPSNHWSGQCSKCHNTNSWGNVSVSGHRFPINHKGADGKCSKCHESKSSNYTCYKCHDKQKMESKHAEKDIFDIANRCASCHPDGKD